MNCTFRYARREDVPVILRFIRELADYEGLLGEVIADEATLETWLFHKESARVLFAVDGEEEIGFALYFTNFSTFLGRAGIYLEDLYVTPSHRGKGVGKALLAALAKIAADGGYGRLEWWCLDENTPALEFYHAMGAEPMTDWTVQRVAGENLTRLAARFDGTLPKE